MSTKSARGTKRTCQACEARFYDLNRNPIVCPVCGVTYVKDARESRRVITRDDDEVAIPAVRAGGAAAAAAGALPEIVAEDDVPEIEADAEDDTFLEAEEEDGDDVGTLIDNPIEGDGEEA